MALGREFPTRALATSLALPCQAEHCADVRTEAALVDVLTRARDECLPVHLLGGGSNVVAMPTVSGLTVLVRIGGVRSERSTDSTTVTVGAGENWQGLVRYCLGQGLGHLANLSLIPGTVGGAPIQNIGAYGVEVASYIERVRVVERDSLQTGWLSHAECGFGYRDSIFRRRPHDFAISQVQFRFPDDCPLDMSYNGIADELGKMAVVRAKPVDVAEAVSRIRRRKLPDPRLIPNAGSFFKNPQLDQERYTQLGSQLGGIASWSSQAAGSTSAPAVTRVKLSAAALIERAIGIDRGVNNAPGVYPWRLQPLVLVHRGGCDGIEVLRVARQIARAVKNRFAIELEREPRIFGDQPRVEEPAGL